MRAHPFLPPLILAVALGACGEDPIIVPTRNLDRPSDMTFVCLGVINDRLSGRPITACHPPGARDPGVEGNGPRERGTFGLVANSGRGELAVVDMNFGRLVDLDPAQPGYNTLPLGTLPEAVTVTPDGCRALTANRGSCDLTLVDTARLLQGTFDGRSPSTGAGPAAERVVLTTGSGRPLQVAAQDVVFLPQPAASSGERVCRREGAWGPDETVVPWRALVTFPRCDLVAMVEFPAGRITSSVRIRPDGIEDLGAEPTCPVECGREGVAAAPADAAAPPDGAGGPDGPAAPSDGSLGVGALALLPDGRRVYVGATGAPFITALDVTAEGLRRPEQGGRIPLHDGPGGVTRLRLSIDPYAEGPGGVLGRFVGNRGEFLYAFARDGSVRVVDVGRRERADFGFREWECDVNVDPAALRPGERAEGCFHLPDDPQDRRLPRRPLAHGPGIRIPIANPEASPPVPRDVAFAQLTLAGGGAGGDQVVDGSFGFLLASSGNVYLVNLDPSVRPGEPVPLTHSFRNAAFNRPPRLSGAPARDFTSTQVPLPTRIPLAPLQGPRIEATRAEDPEDPTITYVRFPEPGVVTPQRWFVVWEDTLPGTDRRTGRVQPPGNVPRSVGRLDDIGAEFCRSGVLARDALLLAGCTRDADCAPDGTTGGAVCRQASPGTPGLCFPAAVGRDDELLRHCTRFMTSRRRYEVLRASRTGLELGLRLDEVPRTSIQRCTKDQDCQPSAGFAGFECLQVFPGEAGRCVKRCAGAEPDSRDDRACRLGSVCESVPGSLVGPLCVEGPPLDPVCWPLEASYRVQVGQAFLVSGTSTPRLPVVREEGGQCVPDLTRHPLVVNRIPLDAPHCSNVEDGTTAFEALSRTPEAAGAPWGNPCLFRSPNGDDPTSPDPRVKALFQNHQLRFVLTNLDQYAGDAAATRFAVEGGFIPSVAEFPPEIIITMGVRIVTGPLETPESPGAGGGATYVSFPYLYVVDQGRAAQTPGGRGQILRLNPRRGSSGLPRFDSNYTTNRFHIQ